ncbi:hypothetical protein HanPSC8_Chr02g0071311 [Helianthus annuus]|nr:hypothetical protein HanPSC8_Chr02g0071311 [Helianthus annuus]
MWSFPRFYSKEDFDEFEDVDMLYNTLSLDMVDALEDLVSIVPPGLVKRALGLSTVEGYTGYGGEGGEKH